MKFVKGLHNVIAEEGKEAVFRCIVSPSDVAVTWSRNKVLLEASKKYVISQKESNHSLTITDLTLEESGEILAQAEGIDSRATLKVEGKKLNGSTACCIHKGWGGFSNSSGGQKTASILDSVGNHRIFGCHSSGSMVLDPFLFSTLHSAGACTDF